MSARDQFVDVPAAGRVLGVSESTIWRMIRRGALPGARDKHAVSRCRSLIDETRCTETPAQCWPDADDADHRAATLIAHEIAGERRPSFIANYVEVEAHALLSRKLRRALARQWLLSGALRIVRVSPQGEERGKELPIAVAAILPTPVMHCCAS
jgi:hypothetical protein